MSTKILAVGDCNTLGAGKLEKNGFPERYGAMEGVTIHNVGHTMATTREGVYLLHDFMDDAEWIFIQFGLVDSYKTFKYSPYILYYPDGIIRKQLRSLIKKYKKICRKLGLNRLFGEDNVVGMEEYRRNIKTMIEFASPRTVVLLDTIPNRQLERNYEISRYNNMLTSISKEYGNCLKVDLYEMFRANFDTFYLDDTHCNEIGHDYIAQKIYEKVHSLS